MTNEIKTDRYELYCGDCLEIMKNIPDNSVDCIITDLPYGTTNCKWDTIIPFDKLWEQYNRIAKPTTPIFLFGTEPFSSMVRQSNITDYRYDLYWHKTLCSNFMMGKKQPFFKIETISVFYKKPPTYNPQMVEGEPYEKKEKHIKQGGMQQKYGITHKVDMVNTGERCPDNLLEYGSLGGKSKFHPTQKPVDLLEWIIKSYTNVGDRVLDNCMGSGSTGVACLNNNRYFIGIEKEFEYFNTSNDRISNI